jgi:hypothetical protein
MKEANTEPIEMNLEELLQFAQNIDEASINLGKDYEGSTRNSKETKQKPLFKKNGGTYSILKGQEIPSCDF